MYAYQGVRNDSFSENVADVLSEWFLCIYLNETEGNRNSTTYRRNCIAYQLSQQLSKKEGYFLIPN